MRLLRVLRLRLRSLFRRGRADAELAREIDLHVEQLVREQMAAGAAEADARRTARLAFGSPDAVREAARDTRRIGLLEDFVADMRHARRVLWRSPGFALTAIVSVALGIGANVAIFGLADAVLLRTLPVQRPHELVFLKIGGSERVGGAPPYPCFDRIRQEVTPLQGLAAFAADEIRVEVDGTLEQVFGQVVSDNYFSTLGLRPAAGRLLSAGDEGLAPPVAVIGYAYWHRRVGGDPSAIGRVIRLGDVAFTIVGVTPREFTGLEPGRRVDVSVPITNARPAMEDAGAWWFEAVGRLAPGQRLEEATARADTVFQSFMRDRPGYGESRERFFQRVVLEPGARGLGRLREQYAAPLLVMGAIGAMVLLIACANLGCLLIARGEARVREMAIRMATGAGTGRLVRQLCTETLLLFVLGTTGGLALAHVALQGVLAIFGGGRRPVYLDVHYDWRLAAFASAVTLLAGVITGLWPAMRALRTDPHQAMKDGEGRVAGSRRATAASRVLVAAQVAVSLVLLVAAVLFGGTMMNLRGIDPGFRGSHVLTMSIDLVLPGEAARTVRPAFHRQVLDAVRAMPGVNAASLAILTPLSGRDSARSVTVAGFEPRNDDQRMARLNHVSEDYFRTFGIPLVVGRAFTSGDTASTRKVAVINAAAARLYFPGRSPIGETIGLGDRASYEIVGIAGNHKHRTLREDPERIVFIPLAQPLQGIGRVTLSVASRRPQSELARAVAAEVRRTNGRALVSDVVSVEQTIDATLVSERLLSRLAGVFGGVALLLAMVGLYGTLSYSVACRRAEFGVRLALGARPAQVAAGVLGEMARPVALGVVLGLPAAWLVARSAAALLFGIEPGAAVPYIASSAALALVAVAASWMPARRACRVDPASALRCE